MRKKTYFITTSILFLIIFTAHVFRLIESWDVTVAGVDIPLWLSWIAAILVGLLGFSAFQLFKNK